MVNGRAASNVKLLLCASQKAIETKFTFRRLVTSRRWYHSTGAFRNHGEQITTWSIGGFELAVCHKKIYLDSVTTRKRVCGCIYIWLHCSKVLIESFSCINVLICNCVCTYMAGCSLCRKHLRAQYRAKPSECRETAASLQPLFIRKI